MAKVEKPRGGGSYTRDPRTGKLVQTRKPPERPHPAREAAEAAAREAADQGRPVPHHGSGPASFPPQAAARTADANTQSERKDK